MKDAIAETNGRDDWIRTSDLTHPKRARYQAAPRPDRFRPLSSVSPAFEKGQDSEKLFVEIEEEFAVRARGRFVARGGCGSTGGGLAIAAILADEMFARAGDGKTLFIEQALDFENGLNVFAAVEPMAAGTFYGLQRGEFGFPVAQDESLGGGEAADFANAEKALLRNRGRSLSGGGHGFSVS
jgi:hypothetical protein